MTTPVPVTRPADEPDLPSESPTPPPAPPPWTALQKLAFRFLFVAGGGLVVIAGFGSLFLNPVLRPVQNLLVPVGAFVSGTTVEPLVPTSSGDSMGIWQYHFGWLALSVPITILWSLLDRRSTDYRALGGLLWQVSRILLASGMIFYGLAKAIPSQMAFMALPTYSLQPSGDISRMNLLWGFMGASAGYSIVTGLIELLSGLFLLSRRTWILGALGSIVSMTQVVLMDTFYNVPVKFLSFEFLVIAAAMLAPQWINLVRVGFGRAAGAAPSIWRAAGADRTWVRRTGKVLSTLSVLIVLAMGVIAGVVSTMTLKDARSPLDGTWHATSFRVDGQEAAQTSRDAWANVAITYRGTGVWETFGKEYNAFVTQTSDARVTAWTLEVDGASVKVTQRKSGPETVLAFTQPDADHLTLTGRVDGHDVAASYRRRPMDRASEPLIFTHPVPDKDLPVDGFP